MALSDAMGKCQLAIVHLEHGRAFFVKSRKKTKFNGKDRAMFRYRLGRDQTQGRVEGSRLTQVLKIIGISKHLSRELEKRILCGL